MIQNRFFGKISLALITVASLLFTSSPSYAARLVTVLVTGFSASSDSNDDPSGLKVLNQKLQNEFGNNPDKPFSSKVFDWDQAGKAFDYINSFDDVWHLVLIGHSFGGDTIIDDLATDRLLPNNIMVDLTIQIDSVGSGDEKLPDNVKMGINYYQISTGTFEPQGEQNVMGAMNINVEELFDDKTITHTTIDGSNKDGRLHDLIIEDIKAKTMQDECPIYRGNRLLSFRSHAPFSNETKMKIYTKTTGMAEAIVFNRRT